MKLTNAIRQLTLGRYPAQVGITGVDAIAPASIPRGLLRELARFKALVLNEFVRDNGVESVIEFGCGDGNQLGLASYPRYLGLDVSAEAIDLCRGRFGGDSTKAFLLYDPVRTVNLERFLSADLTLSLDVIYHLLEDDVYDRYLQMLFACSSRFVIVYSSNDTSPDVAWHVRNRAFVQDVESRSLGSVSPA